MDALRYLDTAIGFTLGMTVLATLIGTVTAAWIAAIRSRSRDLAKGLQAVLSTLDAQREPEEFAPIVNALLRDKMLTSWIRLPRLNIGATEAIGREELVLLLLRNAGKGGHWTRIGEALERIIGQKPADALRAVEREMLEQERQSPSLPATVWRTRALAKVVPELASRLFAQFDDVMTRTEDNTAYSSKVTATLLALAFLVIYPVNAFDMLTRLSTDKAAAAQLASFAAGEKDADKLRAEVEKQGLFGDVFQEHSRHWTEIRKHQPGNCVARYWVAARLAFSQPGVWVTWMLVGMGAPFWQSLLDRLLGLRSKISQKTETERAQRAQQN